VADGIYSLDEHWNGRGLPEGLAGEAIPLISRLALLAQVVDAFQIVGGRRAALDEVRRRTGAWFDPRAAAAFQRIATRLPGEAPGADDANTFWNGLASEGLDARVAALEPMARVILIDDDRLDNVALAFAAVIDAKSSFTHGHSERVTEYAGLIAVGLGMAPARRRWLHRAALLHDIGKLGVSNGILDKPGRLDADEWVAIKRHAELSETILERSAVFRDMAAVAGAHHERLDGGGYPRHLAGAQIPLEARIITTADIFDALTAARPYRGPMPVAEAVAIMERDRDTAIDSACLDALRRHLTAAGSL
jgi:HD-GYP domain-containing protein (c-di-GMP phosphodiesterase class II)